MKINISRLSEGTHSYDLTAAGGEIGLPAEFSERVQAGVTIEKRQRQLFLNVKAAANAVFACDRCAEPVRKEISAEFTSIFSYDERTEEESNEENFYVITENTNVIDLSSDVNEYIRLAVPFKILCSDDCKGLCSVCGKNLNLGSCSCEVTTMDPRWNKLKGLFGADETQNN